MLNWLKTIEKEKFINRRFNKTIDFLAVSFPPPKRILDLGTPNKFSEILGSKGYSVENTKGEDFDLHPEVASGEGFDAVTAFEVLEHLVNPMSVLQSIKAEKLFVTVPLSLWFSRAYRNPSDPWDRHFHEFEDWQFDWLLEKSGWRIQRSEKWTNPSIIPGVRPLLRSFTPRYYAVEAERS